MCAGSSGPRSSFPRQAPPPAFPAPRPPRLPGCEADATRTAAGNAAALRSASADQGLRGLPPISLGVLLDPVLDHFVRAVGLRAGVGYPHVVAVLEDLELAFAAGGAVGGGELLLQRGEHVVVERALHDEERRQRRGLVALEDL